MNYYDLPEYEQRVLDQQFLAYCRMQQDLFKRMKFESSEVRDAYCRAQAVRYKAWFVEKGFIFYPGSE